ncbi:catalase [Chroogloeocystis siderophila]|nr:catalase [Chroogloeocystis siderophila]
MGKQTLVLLRFSTVGGEKGSADAVPDPRDFAVKYLYRRGQLEFNR